MSTQRFPRWSKDGWIRTSESRYVHPEYGVVEWVAGFWTAESHPKSLLRVVKTEHGLTFFVTCKTMMEAMQEAKRYTKRAAQAQKETHG